MNEFKLLGRVGKIDINYKDNGTCYTQVSIGIPNGKKNDDGKKLYDNFFVTFFNTKTAPTAENIAEDVKEGDYIRVNGKLTDNVYTPKDADKPKHSLQLIGWGYCKVVFDEQQKKYVDVKKEAENDAAKEPEPSEEDIPF
jgi:single-stranded DNA-binding protein